MSEDVCGICQDIITVSTSLNNCPHSFCFVCIARWSKESNTCPLCQTRYSELIRHKQKTAIADVDRREENWMRVEEEYVTLLLLTYA